MTLFSVKPILFSFNSTNAKIGQIFLSKSKIHRALFSTSSISKNEFKGLSGDSPCLAKK